MIEKPHLFLEFDGINDIVVNEYIKLAKEICADNNGKDFLSSSDPQEMKDLWEARHNTYYAALHMRPNSTGIVTDACVPIDKLSSIIESTCKDIDELEIIGAVFGHAGGKFSEAIAFYRQNF